MDIVRHYTELLERYGDDPRAVQLADRTTQRRRFAVLYQALGDRRRDSVLDIGCGLAHLHDHLTEQGWEGQYSGIDVTPSLIEHCRNKLPTARFDVHDIGKAPAPWTADWCLLSGVFNNTRADPWAFLMASLRNMLASCKIGISFNFMSTYVDELNPQLVYFDPEAVFQFCKEELSPLVTLRHDYCVRPKTVPFEAAMVVLRSEITPRRRLVGAAR